jgi:prophage tail gpP-like protein
MIWFIDPELRRTLLEEIAFQRCERSKFRRIADDEAEPYGVQVKARMRAEGCNRAIRALRDVWAATAYVERERTRTRLVAS